jgi:Ca-activated chloride channel homolog
MSFLTPLGFLGLLLAGPVVLMYMLRLRRREVLVSSTFLWQQVIQDNEANTPWQRLRRNLLLLLQLLILALLAFALARPFIVVPAVSTGQIALLLDASASMNAADGPDGQTRFELAQQQALDIVETMTNADSMTVIRVADVPEVLLPRSQDKAQLREAINSAAPSAARADWTAALTLAAGTADANSEDFSVVIVGDGGLGRNSGLPGIQGDVEYVPVGSNGGNVAITALATRSLGGATPQLFTQITNYGDEEAEIIFDLTVDGEILTAQRYTIPAAGTVPLVSDSLPADFAVIEAGLTPASGSETRDFLTVDNTAWAVFDRSDVTQALVISGGNVFVDRVLGSLPTVRHLNASPDQGIPQREFDLYVFDSYLPPRLPEGDLLIINPPESVAGLFGLGAENEQTANPRVLTNDDRTAFLDFGSVNIRAFRPLTDAPWAEPLVTVDGGGVLYAGEIDGRQVAVLTFALGESDLPLQIAFPIMMSNLLDWYRPEAAAFAQTAVRVGESLPIRPPATADRVRVTKPDGDRREFDVLSDTFIYADTDQLGIYEVELFSGSNELQSAAFAVNLFDPNESDIAPRGAVQLGGEEVTPAVREELGQREFWQWFALAALLVLMLEWLIYHRRVQGPGAVFSPVLRRESSP